MQKYSDRQRAIAKIVLSHTTGLFNFQHGVSEVGIILEVCGVTNPELKIQPKTTTQRIENWERQQTIEKNILVEEWVDELNKFPLARVYEYVGVN